MKTWGHHDGHDLNRCDTHGCILLLGHLESHDILRFASVVEQSRDIAEKLDAVAKEGSKKMEQINREVLMTMATQDTSHTSQKSSISNLHWEAETPRVVQPAPLAELAQSSRLSARRHISDQPPSTNHTPYKPLNYNGGQIRLFGLYPSVHDTCGIITGFFVYTDLATCPSYTAVSYAWGDTPEKDENWPLTIDGVQGLHIRKNLWSFLTTQSLVIATPRLFWIDAICIDQANLHERNHQVGVMKSIYSTASDVLVWLGPEEDDSDLAMDFLVKKGRRPLRPRGAGYRPIWSHQEGRALRDLCERRYWRRMWIIQEIIHAQQITIWCGGKRVSWAIFDKLYLTLKTLEDTSWFAHHKFAMDVLQSSAFVMVWQRAHWRHADTPIPTLQILVEVFQEWQCSDIRDKVYALVGMASTETAIVPDYSRSAREIYENFNNKHGLRDEGRFHNLLSQLLGIPAHETDLAAHYM